MKYFITSDIHGFHSVLIKELERSGFNKDEDTLITLGDNFDRGYENLEMYQFLISLPHTILIRGNHEDLFTQMVNRGFAYFIDDRNGTIDTLMQMYFHYFSDYEDESSYHPGNEKKIMRRMKTTDFYRWITDTNVWHNEIRFGNFVLTHAGIPTNENPTKHDWEEARWVSPYHNRVPGRILISGHYYAAYARELNGIKDTRHSLHEPYIDKDLIMIDACTAVTHRCNVLIYDDTDGNLYYDGKVVANSKNEVE